MALRLRACHPPLIAAEAILFVIARRAATKQSRSDLAQSARDCFASLAMTFQLMARMIRKSKNPHWGSTLDDFLEEEGIYKEATTGAIEKVIAWQAREAGRKTFVTLRFAGDELDPRKVSAILPVEPTRAHKKGEEFFAGLKAGNLRGRTGMWFLATDKLVDSDALADHLHFVETLLYPEPGDDRRISALREILERTQSRAHITCFWRGGPGEPAPEVPPQFKSAIAPLAAEIETDFVTRNS